ncbi:hypothetical protein PTSG_08432 [Salpingoeca rosetta]|uniref:Transmembrane BAX inhibitor motif-containing protein 4 n=1 Tax=Salpingoeca rosetta (strain ATCC 50818 / BSB-021) TaxID=946362 RepID=F2UJN8_SALR5|nr:uncharacterized protein PTSG_08432 [Salpingoeca rosetta]EGD77337.1 hypothetical protein PTSG_08432 [Salpingoeca rosetta]|eukprot:XP_004990681.1 hypothetical protein PTSG_08432 [Salpingoeca rosetta]
MSTTTTTPAVKTWGDLRPSAPPMSSAATTAASSSSAGNGGKASKQAPFALFGQLPDDQKATSLEDDFNYGVHVASCSVDVRMKFLRKVYGIVAAQLLVTSIVTGIFQFPAISAFVQTFEAGVLLSALFAFVSLVALFVKRHQFPTNLYLLGAFTLAEAYLVGTIVTFYQIHSVLQAAVITTTVVAGLTLFAFQTKYDFTIFNGLLGMLLFSLIGIGFALIA